MIEENFPEIKKDQNLWIERVFWFMVLIERKDTQGYCDNSSEL